MFSQIILGLIWAGILRQKTDIIFSILKRCFRHLSTQSLHLLRAVLEAGLLVLVRFDALLAFATLGSGRTLRCLHGRGCCERFWLKVEINAHILQKEIWEHGEKVLTATKSYCRSNLGTLTLGGVSTKGNPHQSGRSQGGVCKVDMGVVEAAAFLWAAAELDTIASSKAPSPTKDIEEESLSESDPPSEDFLSPAFGERVRVGEFLCDLVSVSRLIPELEGRGSESDSESFSILESGVLFRGGHGTTNFFQNRFLLSSGERSE